jgi:hypothetical protein
MYVLLNVWRWCTESHKKLKNNQEMSIYYNV